MKLSEVFSQLTFGELKQISVGGYEGTKAIAPKDYAEVINHINLALTNLYTKFPLKQSSLVLRTKKDKTKYPLTRNYALTTDPINYHIVDSLAESFLGDILQVTHVYDVYGAELPLNDKNVGSSVITGTYDSLTIPWTKNNPDYIEGTELLVEYRAKPAWISVPTPAENLDLTRDIPIPDTLLEPLLVYIEYRVHKARGGESGLAQAAMAKQHYDALCKELELDNVLHNMSAVTNVKLEQNGWNI